MMRASSPTVEPAGVRRGQEDRHVDVGEVEDRDDRRAGRDHFAGSGELVLHAADAAAKRESDRG